MPCGLERSTTNRSPSPKSCQLVVQDGTEKVKSWTLDRLVRASALMKLGCGLKPVIVNKWGSLAPLGLR